MAVIDEHHRNRMRATRALRRRLCSAAAATGLAAAALALLLPGTSAWSKAKEPPACAAITFRPLPQGLNDGDQDAGLYKSRFGRIVVKGTVKGGQVETYFVTLNGARPAEAASLPKSVATCAAAKHLPAPGKAAGACTGDHLRVLVDHSGDKRYILLYAHQSGGWELCSAGTA
ncbi:MAG TPA: hypothetical protein VKY65_21575 [Alphaproteobacteria bacterium]|nr:hypothetical protein [Alphaproteobacteria bacterium]